MTGTMANRAPTPSSDLAPEWRAAGTDLSERRRSGLSRGPLADIAATADLRTTTWSPDGSARIGALVTVAAIAADTQLQAAYPGITAAAGGLATPQIRHLATIGGNIAQRSRCWYYRNPHSPCLKKGGDACPARSGNHLYGVAFDLGPCVAPHPSTLAAALMAYDATIETSTRPAASIATILGDGSNGAIDHTLADGELIRAIRLPPPLAGERALYKRAIARTYAEWPLAELVARAVVRDGKFELVRLVAGGVAPVPVVLQASEQRASGAAADATTIADCARLAITNARPLPQTAYKLTLLSGLVEDLLTQLAR